MLVESSKFQLLRVNVRNACFDTLIPKVTKSIYFVSGFTLADSMEECKQNGYGLKLVQVVDNIHDVYVGFERKRKKVKVAKRTTLGIPTWSPTVVLTEPDDA